ncbi:single-stranded DNA-binding protein [Myxococcota bacterium]|nr:single-stranded DNA-binding protein [Myxococcota bacterium]MBU1537504.1 single-stranded DNA-binding protein [Myxococcota bacterium]
MADGLNKVILIGHLGADPVHRVTTGSKDVCDFRLATTESWRGDDGNRNQTTEWHRVVVWGRTAVIVKENLSKGSQVYVEGKLRTRKWTDNENRDRYTTEVIASKVLFLGGGKRGSGPDGFNADVPDESGGSSNSYSGGMEDDIPF